MTDDPWKHHRQSLRLRGYDYSQAGAYFVSVCAQDRACLFGEVIGGEMHLNDAGRMVLAEWNRLTVRFPAVELDAFIVMPNHIHGIVVISIPAGPVAINAHANTHVGAGLVPAPRPRETTTAADGTAANPINGAITNPVAIAAAAIDATAANPPATNPAVINARATNPAVTNGATTRVAPTTSSDASNTSDRDAGAVVENAAMRTVVPTLGDIVGAFKSLTTNLYILDVKQSGWPCFRRRLWQRNYHEHIIRSDESLNRIRRYILDNPACWASDLENPQAERREG